MPNWFVIRNGKLNGPFNDSQLKKLASSGKINTDDLIRREDKTDAHPANKFKGLFPEPEPVLIIEPDPETAPEPSKDQGPALWNPKFLPLAGLLLTYGFGSYIASKNWLALGEPDRAKKSMFWFYSIFGVVILSLFTSDTPIVTKLFWFGGTIAFIVWGLRDAKPQWTMVKERYGENYTKRSWLKPVGAALGCMLLFAVIAGVVRYDPDVERVKAAR